MSGLVPFYFLRTAPKAPFNFIIPRHRTTTDTFILFPSLRYSLIGNCRGNWPVLFMLSSGDSFGGDVDLKDHNEQNVIVHAKPGRLHRTGNDRALHMLLH